MIIGWILGKSDEDASSDDSIKERESMLKKETSIGKKDG
jgi:hypothetical protein